VKPIVARLIGGPRDGEEVVLPPWTMDYEVPGRFGPGHYRRADTADGIVLRWEGWD
jgi:hypothetical protein